MATKQTNKTNKSTAIVATAKKGALVKKGPAVKKGLLTFPLAVRLQDAIIWAAMAAAKEFSDRHGVHLSITDEPSIKDNVLGIKFEIKDTNIERVRLAVNKRARADLAKSMSDLKKKMVGQQAAADKKAVAAARATSSKNPKNVKAATALAKPVVSKKPVAKPVVKTKDVAKGTHANALLLKSEMYIDIAAELNKNNATSKVGAIDVEKLSEAFHEAAKEYLGYQLYAAGRKVGKIRDLLLVMGNLASKYNLSIKRIKTSKRMIDGIGDTQDTK